jgi:ubiquitin carboxyl-terminal hydrolase 36/42
MYDFLREEVLDGENAYKCDKCHKKTRATKKYSIRTAPNVLVVHLKRFDFSSAGKLSHFVSYPEQLSLKNFVSTDLLTTFSGSSNDSKEKLLQNVSYKLYGVLVHLGHTSHSGHYYSYVKGPNEVWYKADDQRVSENISKNVEISILILFTCLSFRLALCLLKKLFSKTLTFCSIIVCLLILIQLLFQPPHQLLLAQ